MSGAPSTAHAIISGRDPLEAVRAAGTLLLRDDAGDGSLVVAGVVAHVALSLGWGGALGLLVPRRHAAIWGAAVAVGVHVLDVELVGRGYRRVRSLPRWPQLADHVAFGATAGWVLGRLRASRSRRLRLRAPAAMEP